MDKGFARKLTERERIMHGDHYHNYRNRKFAKGLIDDEVGGRESMKIRYKLGGFGKTFNENLNPLWGWLRSCVGKNWDKKYSELRTQFDARKVINAHILEHLFQDVEIHTHVGEKGAVMFMDTRFSNRGEMPISLCSKDYYVCPKSGMLRKTHKQPRHSIVRQREVEVERKQLETTRYLNDKEVLHLVDGVWYHYDLLPIPEVKVVYCKPLNVNVFKTGYQFLGTPNSRREKTWDELNEAEQQRFGKETVLGATVKDLFHNCAVYRDQHGHVRIGNAYHRRTNTGTRLGIRHKDQELYHATKSTASHRQLKQAGLA